jgi:putative flippase GtrA
VHTDIRLLVASIVAVEVAIVSQFNFHERWTFRDRNRAGWLVKRFFKYNASSIVSPIITVVTVNVLTPIIHDNTSNGTVIYALAPYLANTLGVLMGFTWNWTLNSLVIWPHHRDEAAA